MIITIILSILILFGLTGCSTQEINEELPQNNNVEIEETLEEDIQEEIIEEETFEEEIITSETNTASVTPVTNDVIKVTGGSDEVGIYAIVVSLKNGAADKGVIEMVYHGAKGSPQENSIVNNFRIEYYKEEAGTYEISTFYDGEVYQNQHHKYEMKVVNEYGANLRAGDVTVYYTPDGGEKQEVFKADADYFKTK